MTINWTPPEGTRITYPRRGLDDKDFNFKRGSDVQALWREYGWVPPSESKPPMPEVRYATP